VYEDEGAAAIFCAGRNHASTMNQSFALSVATFRMGRVEELRKPILRVSKPLLALILPSAGRQLHIGEDYRNISRDFSRRFNVSSTTIQAEVKNICDVINFSSTKCHSRAKT
jgi:hypothetical protein